MPRWLASTMYTPLASHTSTTSPISIRAPPRNCFPPASPGTRPPPLPPSKPDSFCLSRLHSSSRSGGPSFPRLPQLRVVQRHEISLMCSRPGAGELTPRHDRRIRERSLRPEFVDGNTHEVHTRTSASAHAKPRDSTIFISLQRRRAVPVKSVLFMTRICGNSLAPISPERDSPRRSACPVLRWRHPPHATTGPTAQSPPASRGRRRRAWWADRV